MKEVLNFLENQRTHHTPEELKKCIDLLDINLDSQKVILVAGTNGKGSTCATLQTLLLSAGKNVGFFSSPHLIKINERIKYNGKDISDEDFVRIFRIIKEKVSDRNLSFFEYLTLIAIYYYHELPIDFAIFEIGMGGTLDATNALEHDISVITKLGLDHEDILGKGLPSIAKNKFGIIRRNNKVFHTPFTKEVMDIYQQYTKRNNVQSFEAPVLDYFARKNEKSNYPEYSISINNENYKLNLLGKRAVENTSLAIEIFKYLVKNYEQYLPMLQTVNWSCRMEKFRYKDRDIFLSGDHNPQAIQTLIEILKYFEFEHIHFVIGTCFDKDYNQMIQILHKVKNSHIYLTETTTKILDIENYSEFVKSIVDFSVKSPLEALDLACSQASINDLVVVTGSLYLTGLIKKLILQYT